MKLRFSNPDRVVSLSAIFISISTLFVLIYQTNIMRQQQRLSVLPHLMLSNEHIGTPNYRLVLRNNGIGPAFIESIKIKYEGKEFDMDFANFLIKEVPGFDTLENVYYSNIGSGQLIPAEKSINILQVENSIKSSNELYALIGELINKGLKFELIYSSIYEEKWILSDESETPKRID